MCTCIVGTRLWLRPYVRDRMWMWFDGGWKTCAFDRLP